MEEKNVVKVRISTIILCIIVVLLIAFIAVILINNPDVHILKSADSTESEKSINIAKNETETNEATENENTTPKVVENSDVQLAHFNPNKGVLADSSAKYTLDNNSISEDFSVRIESDNKVGLMISLPVTTNYNIDAKLTPGYPSYITGFSKNVDEVTLGYCSGQELIESGLIVFLMEDGTLEYISLYDALQTDNLKSRGQLGDLKNIVRVESASVQYSDGSVMTLVAIDKDGNFYDLGKVVEENNIELYKVN